MTRQEMIKRLRNCVIPSRYSQYPKKWYDSLTDAQLFRMCEEIEIDGPTEEDYIEDEEIIEESLSEEEVEQRVLEANCPTFPYRFNPENGDYEVYTESKQWEKVYD